MKDGVYRHGGAHAQRAIGDQVVTVAIQPRLEPASASESSAVALSPDYADTVAQQ